MSRLDETRCQLAREGRAVQAYNEGAFRYLLNVERSRARRLGTPLLLLLVTVSAPKSRRIDPGTAQKLFARLWLATRETDFVGWYREGRIAGVALTQRSEDMSSTEVARQIRDRVSTILDKGSSTSPPQRFKVRVYRLISTIRTSDNARQQPIARS